ncbi:MAG: UDP-N-acetylmuramoyl-L-alanyl-D-glutamate--2,6-diaminopimelate ligase [Saprospiraceae bacterium]
MKSLGNFLPFNAEFEIKGSVEKNVNGFSFNSKNVGSEIAFVAKKGTYLDGHDFIADAINHGCELVFCEKFPLHCPEQVTFVKCDSISRQLGDILNAFYNYDLTNLILIGVTGTNGKTTIVTLLYQLFGLLGYKCGLISTVENRIADKVIPATHTTPDQIALYDLLYQMQKNNCSHVFMEVSSHALDQKRIGGLNFTGAIFTNITHDHLDYHKTFKAYIDAKKYFFDTLDKKAFALVNKDDVNASIMVQNTKAKVQTYALHNMADFRARILENSFSGLHLKFGNTEWFSRLIGSFNAYNLAAVYGCSILMGYKEDEVLKIMSTLLPPKGRFDWIRNEENGKIGIVDFAHTPDALEKILKNIIEIKSKEQKIITVIGCGGDRDKTKRPEMGQIASRLSDRIVLTSDNPRSEDPFQILKDIEKGILESKKIDCIVIEDRAQAIKSACMISGNNDIILIAGKGHEKYQEIKGQKLPFDDLENLKTYLLNL